MAYDITQVLLWALATFQRECPCLGQTVCSAVLNGMVMLCRTLVVMDALFTTVFPGTKSRRFNPNAAWGAMKKGGVDKVAHQNAMAYDVVRAKIHKTHSAVFRGVFVNHLNQERKAALQAECEQESD